MFNFITVLMHVVGLTSTAFTGNWDAFVWCFCSFLWAMSSIFQEVK